MKLFSCDSADVYKLLVASNWEHLPRVAVSIVDILNRWALALRSLGCGVISPTQNKFYIPVSTGRRNK